MGIYNIWLCLNCNFANIYTTENFDFIELQQPGNIVYIFTRVYNREFKAYTVHVAIYIISYGF